MGVKKLLTRSQMNEVFITLQEYGLEPVMPAFQWREELWSHDLKTIHSALYFTDGPRDYFFRFIGQGKYAPDYYPTSEFGRHQKLDARDDWKTVMTHVNDWGKALSRELLVPDYWSTPDYLAIKVFGTIASYSSNEPFSSWEVEQIRDASREYRRQLSANYRLTPRQSEEIDRKLDYLITEAATQTRQAWLHTAIGIVVAIAATIRPEAGVLAGAIALFSSVFALGTTKRIS